MVALLPAVSFILLLLIFESKENCREHWQRSFLSAAIGWGCILTVITEGLSSTSTINFSGCLTAWLISSSILAVIYWQIVLSKAAFKQQLSNLTWLRNLKLPSPFFTVSWISLIAIVTIVGLVAAIAPPNTWDSMTYHMSRVVNWIQDQNVEHYPTHIIRQLDSSPWAEFAILQLQVLSGSDRFANLVQWFSMVGSLVGVSLIAKQLGASLVGQMLSSLLCLTLPMGLLQASSTQNDYALSFWLICFAANVLLAISQPVGLRVSLELGASLGLAVLTKPTAYFYAFPFCVLLAIGLIYFFRWRVWQPSALITLLFLVINSGFWWRNFKLFGSPIGITSSTVNVRNQLLTLPGLISNLSRNIALHLATPYQPLNDAIEHIILELHYLIGLGISDSRTTYLQQPFQIPIGAKNQPIFLHEDISGNLIHLILFVVSLILYLHHRRLRTDSRTSYLAAVVSTFLCLSYFLTWQPWGSRLHLPFFVLTSAFIGTVFSRTFRYRFVHYLLITTLVIFSIPYLLFNASRPISINKQFTILTPYSILTDSRMNQYFNSNPSLRENYLQAVQLIGKQNQQPACSKVGLYLGGNSYEYPFWVLLNQQAQQQIRFQSVNVSNVSAQALQHRSRQFIPCAVIGIDVPSQPKLAIQIKTATGSKRVVYKPVQSIGAVQVYKRRSQTKSVKNRETT